VLLLIAATIAVVHEPFWFDGPAVGVLLLGFGAWLLFADHDSRRRAEVVAGSSNAVSAGATTLPGGAGAPIEDDPMPSPDTPAGVVSPDETMPTVPEGSPSTGPQGEVPPPVPPWGPGSPSGRGPLPLPPESPRHNGRTWSLWVGAICIVGGVVALLQVLDVVDLAFSTTVAGMLLAVGVAMVVGAWYGRARWLALPALVLLTLLLTDDVMDVPLDAGTGDRTVVVDLDHLRPKERQLAAGQLTVDLRRIDPAPGEVPKIKADVGLGQLVVILPDDMIADVDARVKVGSLDADGRPSTDGGVDLHRNFNMEKDPDGRTERPRDHVDLRLRVGMGNIEVRYG
jgi:hypothetical protein